MKILIIICIAITCVSRASFAKGILPCESSDPSLVFESLDKNDLLDDYLLINQKGSSWWKIYEDSFPEEERVHPLRTISHHNSDSIALQLRQGEQVIGIGYFYLLKEISAGYLTYMATRPEWRGKAIGSQIFGCVQKEIEARLKIENLGPYGIVWEVESPEVAHSLEDTHLRQRRIHYYERLGGRILSKDYVSPPLSPEGSRVPMYLMGITSAGYPFSVETITRIIHERVYHRYQEPLPPGTGSLPCAQKTGTY